MALQLDLSITELIIISLALICIFPMVKRWEETKNRVYIAISVYMSAISSYSVILLLSYIFNIDTKVKFIGYLPIGFFLGYLMFTIQAVFLLYVMGWKRLYSFPFIASFYLCCVNILVDTSIHFIIYAMIISWVPAFFFMRQGRRTRNGIAFGMGLFLLIWGLGQSVPIPIVFQFFRITALCIFYLGVRGFFEKYIFVDEKEETKIKSVWITKFVDS